VGIIGSVFFGKESRQNAHAHNTKVMFLKDYA
jgi:hypothetical protein